MNFQTEYNRLNKNQKKAVDTTEGPVLVLAGPGTGKTQVLTLRIAHIIKTTDTPPDAILALTFTDSAAQEMRERLINLIGATAYSINIHTFHAFCQNIIKENPDLFAMATESQALSDLEKTQIFSNIIFSGNIKSLKPPNTPLYYLRGIRSSITSLKRENITPKEFEKIINQEEADLARTQSELNKTEINKQLSILSKNRDLLHIYTKYQEWLCTEGRFDFEDMINFVADGFELNPDILLSYQEKLNYILVDEYQDTNSAQNKIIFSLCSFWGENANIFAVGDPNQSIFRFQGSSMENVMEFASRFPSALLVDLDQNYRSTQTVLNVAHSCIKNNPTLISKKKSKPLLSNQSQIKETKLRLLKFNNGLYEDFFIGKKIKSLINKGVNPNDIAIIARNNQDLINISDTLKRLDVPFHSSSSLNALSDPDVKKFITLLRVIDESPHSSPNTEIFTLLNYNFLKIDELEVLKLAKSSSNKRQDIVTTALQDKLSPQATSFFNHLASWQKLSANSSLPELFETVFRESGLLNYILKQPNPTLKLEVFSSLFYETKLMAHSKDLTLSSFLKNIELMNAQKIAIPILDIFTPSQSVSLITAHKAKGKEYNTVFIYKAINKKWGGSNKREAIKLPQTILEFGSQSKDDELSEERRLFYVALTRAKQNIFITYAKNYITEYGTQFATPSIFIPEIPSRYIKTIISDESSKDTKQISHMFVVSPPQETVSSAEKEYLKEIISSFKLSVTALNTYLKCAYKFKLNNLYKIPRSKQGHLAFGTAVHKALEKFHRQLTKTKTTPPEKFLISSFENALKEEILTSKQYKLRLNQGRDVLSAYYHFYRDDFHSALAIEKFFGSGNYSHISLQGTQLTGKIDRIDILSEQDKTVKVIDYKTGKKKTRGQIEGTTKDSDGDNKRQLVFYKLLSELDKNFKYRVAQAELDFVERPSKENRSGREVFTITDSEIEALKKQIITIMEEIRNLKFERTNDLSICQNCELKDHCWPEGIPKTVKLAKTH